MATYFVTRYWQLLLLRVLTGISVGGTLPLIYSLVGDLFDVKKRAPVAAAIQVATGVGLAAGQAISGFVGGSNLLLQAPAVCLPSVTCFSAAPCWVVHCCQRDGLLGL